MKAWKKIMATVAGVAMVLYSTQAAYLTFTGMDRVGNEQPLGNTYFYSGCYVPVEVKVNPEGVSTVSVDVKYFTTGTFEYQANTAEYTGFEPGVFEVYYNFGNPNADDRIGTGTANGVHTGWLYEYINAYNQTGAGVSGTAEQKVVIVYLKPALNVTTGHLEFYFAGAGVSTDDSNVSSGVNNNTQYTDVLTTVKGDGDYEVVNTYGCPFRPYVIEWSKYYSTIGTNLPNAVAGKENNVLTTLNVYDPFSSTDHASETVVHKAGPDLNTGSYTSYDTWNVWTNQPIVIKLSGNQYYVNGQVVSDIKLDPSTYASQYVRLSGTNDWSAEKVFVVTGNVTVPVKFYNRIGNDGQKYQSGTNDYYDDYLIDVFWYDTQTPEVLTSVIAQDEGYVAVALQALASTGPSNEISGWHADWTDSDDMIRIIGFSGTNTTSYAYNTTTGYNQTLNDLYVADGTTTDQVFGMEKTGVVLASTNPPTPASTQTGAIVFTEPWSGWVYYTDIAGNVGKVWVTANPQPKYRFEVKVSPAFREAANDKSISELDFWLAYKDDNGNWQFTYNSEMNADHPKISINENGTGEVTTVVPPLGKEYLVVIKGTGMLSMGFTGTWDNDVTDQTTNVFDFSGAKMGATDVSATIYPSVAYNSTYYKIGGDVYADSVDQYDYINAGDLTWVNTHLTVGAFDSALRYMDLDLNNAISAIEQAIVIQYAYTDGWMNKYADGTNYPAKDGGFRNF